MKMNSENTHLLITLLILGGIMFLYATDNDPKNTSPYAIILALSLPQILRAFPKMRELGVGSSQFIPNLYTYFQKKLRRPES